METPVGNGYIFQIDIPENYMYNCKSLEKENSIFTIYQKGEKIYWIPESNIFEQIYSGENEKLINSSPNCVNECEFEIVVYNENKEILWKMYCYTKKVNYCLEIKICFGGRI